MATRGVGSLDSQSASEGTMPLMSDAETCSKCGTANSPEARFC